MGQAKKIFIVKQKNANIEIRQTNYTSTTVHILFMASCLMTGEIYRGIHGLKWSDLWIVYEELLICTLPVNNPLKIITVNKKNHY